jgi:NADH:ubiquinone oxidoreductase, NADH-binding (51 kD) subunit
MHESCGKCTPCRVGTRWLVQILRAVEDGRASENDLEVLLDVCDRIIGKCLCVLGDSAAMPVASCVTSSGMSSARISSTAAARSARTRRLRTCSRRRISMHIP